MKISSRVLSVAMGVAMVSGLALVGVAPANAVTSSAKASFIASMVTPAQQAQRKFGVPTSVSIAQAIVASDWGTSAPAKQAKNFFDTPCSASMTAAQFAKLAEAQVGKPYVLGAYAAISNTNPAKFDCSELVKWLFGRSGNPITDLAAWQYDATKKVASGTSPRAGDLVFLRNNPARSNGIGHVAVLTKKLSSGDWEVIEARGRAYGVVKTTLSYWKQRSYYAGLRRYSKLVFANSDGVEASSAALFQSGCVTISSVKYAKFGTVADSFAGHASAVVNDSAYKAARGVIDNIGQYVGAIAKVESPKDPAAYAKTINGLIDSYNLTDYDVVPFDLVLLSGSKGAKVTALQHLLRASGSSVKVTGTYDSATKSAVKKYQSTKKVASDGEAGPITLSTMFTSLSSGATGDRVTALNTLLAAIGRSTTAGSSFGKETQDSLKALQSWAGRSATGVADANTWAMLFMTPDKAPAPVISGTPQVTQTLTAAAGTWSPGSFTLRYQWYRGGAPIAGAIASTYTLTPADAGAAVTVVVAGTRPGYTPVQRAATATGAV
ncbi:MAG TPA: peptidoglycan-binding protein, partial [Propionicimonas sp.]|nr:peptidoglycan-binding protein [Propionicimonas sp.]